MRKTKFWACVAIATFAVIVFACENSSPSRTYNSAPRILPDYIFSSSRGEYIRGYGYKIDDKLIIINIEGGIAVIQN